MADAQSIFLNALMGGSTGANMEDLGMFQKDIAANDTYGQIGDALMGNKFNTQTWTPQQTGLTTALQMFAGTLLKDLGERDQISQINKVAKILPDLTSSPDAVAVPEGVDPLSFAKLKMNVAAKNNMARNQRIAELSKDLWGVDLKKREAAASAEGKIEGENAAYGVQGASLNPNDPRLASADKFRNELLNNKDIAAFSDVRDRMKVLQKAMVDPSSVADLDFYVGIAKILDPGSVVRQSEGQAVIESSSIPAAILGQLNKAINGKSAVPRSELYALAQRHYDVRSGRVASILDDYAERAKARGITENIFPFSKESLDISADTPTTLTAAPKFKASDLIAKGYKLSADGKQWEIPK